MVFTVVQRVGGNCDNRAGREISLSHPKPSREDFSWQISRYRRAYTHGLIDTSVKVSHLRQIGTGNDRLQCREDSTNLCAQTGEDRWVMSKIVEDGS